MGKITDDVLPGILHFGFLDNNRPQEDDLYLKEPTNTKRRTFRVRCQEKPEEIAEITLQIQHIYPEVRNSNCKNLQFFAIAFYQDGYYKAEIMISKDRPHSDYIKLYYDQPLQSNHLTFT